jgi:kynureninase
VTIDSATSLYKAPNPLAVHYTRARVSERVLLTGHSHQAWPDRAALGQQRAWDDAMEWLDAKWERAFERADRIRAGFARLLDAAPETISLGANTHELMVRWLSALPLRERPRVITTDAEFHSARRQLMRLEEEGIKVQRVAAYPSESVAERLADAVDDRAAALIVSTVFYDSAEIVRGLDAVARACERHGVALLLDSSHQLNVVPFSLREQGLQSAYVTGGGYKYCQLGEGNCFLRAPEDCVLRPVITGWFAEFGALTAAATRVSYGPLSTRFAGATYDPTSHYRGAEVFDFFAELGLTPALLREVSQHQIALLQSEIAALELPPALLTLPSVAPDRIAGFLALRSTRAAEIQRALLQRGIATDCRGDVLRLGPAPYLSDDQLREAVAGLGEVARVLLHKEP